MATKTDYTEAQKITKDYYDSQNEREIASRQLIAAKETAIQDAIERGIKNPKDPKNWDPDLDLKVIKQNEVYGTAAANEKKQRENVAQYVNNVEGFSGPEDKQKMLEASGLKPGDINTSLYATKNESIQTNVIEQRAQEIQKQAEQVDRQIIDKLGDNLDKSTALTEQKSTLDPIKDADKIRQIDTQLAEISKNDTELLLKQYKNNENFKPGVATKAAKDEYEKNINLKADDVTATTKIANTGFESINNNSPFYMQMPTLQSINDFRLKNGFSPYGNDTSLDSIARDAVNFRIFETVPGVARAEEIKGTKLVRNIIDDSRVQSVGSFTIYPSDMNWLSQSHSHTYGSGGEDWIASTINALGEGYSAVQSLMKAGAGAAQALNQGSIKGLQPTGDVYQRRLEVLKYYQESAPQSMTVTFNLFTKKDFLNDVFRPIMFLTALGYPKRVIKGEGADNFKLMFDSVRQWAEGGNTYAQNIIKGLFPGQDIQKSVEGILNQIQNLENSGASIGGIGPYRYFISKRPEFLSVRHVSGLFNFPLANITGFNYNFKGPWYNYEGNPLATGGRELDALISQKMNNFRPNPDSTFTDRLDQIFKNFAAETADAIKGDTGNNSRPEGTPGSLLYLTTQDNMKIKSNRIKHQAYPSYAECSITIQSSIPFFRDDYMALYNASNISPEELVTVTQKNTGDERFFGGRKAMDNQAF